MKKDKAQNIYEENETLLLNFLRCLIMLEKTLERIARQNYNKRSQYPELFIEIEQAILTVRAWIECHKIFSGFPIFQTLLAVFVKSITDKIAVLIETSRPVKGKKAKKKSFRTRQQEQLYKSVDTMIGHLLQFQDQIQIFEEPVIDEVWEEALIESFKKDCLKEYKKRRKDLVSQRGEKTYIFPWKDPAEDLILVADKKRFKIEVINKLRDYAHATGRKPECKCQKKSLYGTFFIEKLLIGKVTIDFPMFC